MTKQDRQWQRIKKHGFTVPCCVVGPSQQLVIPGWSRLVAVISPELSEVTACAVGEKQRDEGITQKHD